jgi:hypothetical protein
MELQEVLRHLSLSTIGKVGNLGKGKKLVPTETTSVESSIRPSNTQSDSSSIEERVCPRIIVCAKGKNFHELKVNRPPIAGGTEASFFVTKGQKSS